MKHASDNFDTIVAYVVATVLGLVLFFLFRSRPKPGHTVMQTNLPDGWTDDMSINLPPGRTNQQIVQHILSVMMSDEGSEKLLDTLVNEFQLSQEDAELAIDRTLGGVVRASTGNPLNRPHWAKDPLAAISYEMSMKDRQIIKKLRPA
jgi:hypothetical protein